MKKIIILSVVLLQTIFLSAQMHGKRSANMMPAFNVKNAAGIIKYDEEKVLKKVKIKDEKVKKQVSIFLTSYNNTIDEIIFLNTYKFKEIETQRELAMATRDREAMMDAKQEIKEKLAPIKQEVKIATDNLNANLKKIVSEKQYRKWIKYQERKQNALKPKSTLNQQRGQGRGQGHGGGRGGMKGF